jgi:hypothetical protein
LVSSTLLALHASPSLEQLSLALDVPHALFSLHVFGSTFLVAQATSSAVVSG